MTVTVPHDKILVRAKDIEIETAFSLTAAQADMIARDFRFHGYELDPKTKSSIYFDEPDLTLLIEGGLTLRTDPEILSKNGKNPKSFEMEVGIKFVDKELQALSNRLAAGLIEEHGLKATPPVIRREIERKVTLDRYPEKLDFSMFPEEIKDELCKRLGKVRAANLDLNPEITTTVPRRRFRIFYDPDKNQIHHLPTEEMKKAGKEVCIEVSLEKDCLFIKPPEHSGISQLVDILRSDKPQRGTLHSRIEYEFKRKHSGAEVTSKEALLGCMRIEEYMRHIARNGHEARMPRIQSKLITGLSDLKKCRPGGRLYSKFKAALAFAP